MKLFDVYSVFPINIIRGKGCYVYDDCGNSYLDFYGGHAVISIGHSHPYLIKCMSEQMQNLMFYSNSVINKLQEKLAYELGEISGYPDYGNIRLSGLQYVLCQFWSRSQRECP